MKRLTIPLVMVALGLVATFLFDIGQGPAVVGIPDWSRVVVDPASPFQEEVYVDWMTTDGTSGSDFVAFPESARGAETLPVRLGDGGATVDGVTLPVYAVVAAISVLLGIVVDYSVRGYGYVRGTGQVSETPDLDVGEDRGFYWRT